jgi:hypothetical protein
VVVAARSKDAPMDDSGIVSSLYRASAGTSVAAPLAAGTCALILAAKPAATKEDIKQYLLRTAARDSDVNDSHDARWGAGKLDSARAVEAALGVSERCGCTTARRSSNNHGAVGFGVLLACLAIRRARCLRARYPRVT